MPHVSRLSFAIAPFRLQWTLHRPFRPGTVSLPRLWLRSFHSVFHPFRPRVTALMAFCIHSRHISSRSTPCSIRFAPALLPWWHFAFIPPMFHLVPFGVPSVSLPRHGLHGILHSFSSCSWWCFHPFFSAGGRAWMLHGRWFGRAGPRWCALMKGLPVSHVAVKIWSRFQCRQGPGCTSDQTVDPNMRDHLHRNA